MSEQRVIEHATVLANRGVPVVVYKTASREVQGQEGQPSTFEYEPVIDDVTKEIEIERKFVSMNALVVASIEERHGSLEAWMGELESKPSSTVLNTLSAVWRESKGAVSARLLEGRIDEYVTALQVAAYRSQGVGVDDLGKLLSRGMWEAKASRENNELMVADLIRDSERLETALEEALRKRAEQPQSDDVDQTESELQPTNEHDSKDEPQEPSPGPTG